MYQKAYHIHFVGIGGIGMSGIAEVMHNLGYSVQGSDMSENANVKRLRELGITVHVGHDPSNLGESQVVVASTAVQEDNPEILAARSNLIPVVRRARPQATGSGAQHGAPGSGTGRS